MGSTLSELRKEVAHKLAAIGSSFEMQPEQQIYTPMGFLAFITLGDAKAEPIEVMAALSDLIDPTCRNKQVAYNRSAPREFRTDNFICSACGETFFADGDWVNHPIDWAYCPNCGARVVSEDETIEVDSSFVKSTKLCVCLTVTQAAEELGVSQGRVSQLINSGGLDGVIVDGKRMVTIASVNKRKKNPPAAHRPRKE